MPGGGSRGAVRSTVPSATLGWVDNQVSGMPCCAGGRWSRCAEEGIHCSARPGSAGGKAPGCSLGRRVGRLRAPLPTVAAVQELLNEGCFGRLGRLVRVVSWTWKPAEGFLSVGRGMGAVPRLASEGSWDNQDLTDPQTGLAAAAYACTPDLRREMGQPLSPGCTGERGLQGFVGSVGNTGPQEPGESPGPAGDRGPKGAQGAKAVEGEEGPAGQQESQGRGETVDSQVLKDPVDRGCCTLEVE
ncbi:collagen alpha-2(I) chain-like isoform X2 [Engraulis encrasicolus]|uniref:collagen alpha-2(I) chain-like isoform X2 n=1 Tax=Engraulis encrasicolus TaxID=184585 RepID=UPI002FD3EB4E